MVSSLFGSRVDRLETPLKCSALLTLCLILFCRGTDDLDFSTGGGLQDGCGIDGALCGTCANDGVNLINEEDVVLGFLPAQQLLHAVLKLAILGSCYPDLPGQAMRLRAECQGRCRMQWLSQAPQQWQSYQRQDLRISGLFF